MRPTTAPQALHEGSSSALISGAAETLDLADVRRQTNNDGPYAEFNATVAKSTKDVYSGPMRHLGGGPDAVAKVIEKALKSKRPKIRYTVTASAKMSIASRRLVGARAWDAAMKSQFPQPRKSSAPE